MENFAENDLLGYVYGLIYTLLSAGSPTADVYTSFKQRTDVDYTSTHGMVVLHSPFEGPMNGTICGQGIWASDKEMSISAYIVGESRSVAYEIYERIENLLDGGQFQDTSLATPLGPSVLMYTEYRGTRVYPTDSELYGLVLDFVVYFYRVSS